MNQKRFGLVSTLIALVFAVTIILLSVGIAGDYRRGPRNAEDLFRQISDQTAGLLSSVPAESDQFVSAVRKTFTPNNTVAALRIESNGRPLYEYPAMTFDAHFSSPFIHTYSSHIGTTENGVILTAAIYTLRPVSIFYRARIAFLVILTGTLAAAVLLLYLYLSESENDKNTSNEKVPAHTTALNQIPETQKEENTQIISDSIGGKTAGLQDSPDISPVTDFVPISTTDQSGKNVSETEDQIPIDNVQKETEADEQPEEEQTQKEKTATENNCEQASPLGLFSPVTGFGWESYLPERLENELVRAASSEQDLSLFIFRIIDLDRNAPFVKEICKVLLDAFTFPDMLFEYGNDGFAAIKLNENIDNALKQAEELQSDITAIIRKNNAVHNTVVGISSRSLRIISSDRLLVEADQALRHAIEDTESPIVAFRVNPDKYRAYLAEDTKPTDSGEQG